MKIVCGSCTAKYTVSDDKVQGKSVKVKCRKCGAVIVVSPNGEVRTEGGAPTPSVTYTVSVSDTDQRSMTLPDIVAAYNEGVIDAETFVWSEGMDDWAALKDVDAIVDALHAAAQADAAPVATAMTAPGTELDRTMAMSEGAGMPSYEAALAAQREQAAPMSAGYPSTAAAPSPFGGALGATMAIDPGASGGLFGGAPAPAPAPATSAPGASLFAGATTGSMFNNISTSAAPATSSKSEENSAIFSLNTLTAKVASGPAKKASNTEDSGLIDLRALASSVNSGTEIGMAPSAGYGDGGLFSIPAPPPPAAAPVAAAPVAPPQVVEVAKPANKGLLIGLGGLVLVLIGAVVFLATRQPAPPPVAAPTAPTATQAAAAIVAPTATATAEAAPQAEPTAVADAATGASASAAAAAPNKAAGAAVAKGGSAAPPPPPKSGGAAAPPPPPPPAAAAPPPPAKTTAGGCKPDDLMCLMRAGAKKKK
jgi:predicted Zn finger-like uncharacterized protein